MKPKIVMKHFKLTILFLFVSMILFAQEKKNSITITGLVIYYDNYEKKNFYGPSAGYYENVISPGMECLYSRQISKTIYISSGINYVYGRNSSYISEPKRFRFHEISIPVLLKTNFIDRKKGVFSMNTGLYFGKTFGIITELPSRYNMWPEMTYYKFIAGYSEDINFIDLYFDLGYSIKLNNINSLNLSPFLKYRVNKTWLSTHQKETQYGLKLSYSFKL